MVIYNARVGVDKSNSTMLDRKLGLAIMNIRVRQREDCAHLTRRTFLFLFP